MAIQLWNESDHIKKMPSDASLTKKGRRPWDYGIKYKTDSNKTRGTFTMPSFGRQGRWGNMVFQYIFMRILALNNNRDIELFRSRDSINERMCLYKDMQDIPTVQTKSMSFLIMDYQFGVGYIPTDLWRTMYVSHLMHKKCYVVKNGDAAVRQQLPLSHEDGTMQVEGAFLFKSYNHQNKEYILSELFKPNEEFNNFISDCLKQFGTDKTIIGIHIRRGDTIRDPLGQLFDLPVPVKYFMEWLKLNIPHIKNPVIFVSSDEREAYKEIEMAGLEVFHTKRLLLDDDRSLKYEKYEQVDWEIMRHCDILLTSNSTFSFSAALLSNKNPTCYRFSASKKQFYLFQPWDSNPLHIYSFKKYMWTTLYSRFALVREMVSLRKACYRVAKDFIFWMYWKATKIRDLYYLHGFSWKYLGKIFNPLDLFQVPKNNRADHNLE